MGPWDLLGMEPTQDVRAIKRAYSAKLKTTRPDDDAAAYQALREAYDWAQHYAKYYVAYDVEEIDEEADQPLPQPEPQTEPAPAAPAPVPMPIVEPVPAFELSPVQPEVVVEQESFAQGPTVESMLEDCARVWAHQGGKGLSQAWPRFQTQLEDMPITQYQHASRVFAQFVAEESDLPVDVLVALTRHFQWGVDFRADQQLGAQLAQGLHQRLIVAEVFAAFRPERYTQYDSALALTKLWDDKRRVWARLLALCLDCHTRHRVLQAKKTTLHALGASRAAVAAIQEFVGMGGVLQGILFVLLVVGGVVAWTEPGMFPRSILDALVLGAVSLVLFFPLLGIPDYDKFLSDMRSGHNLDWMAAIPVVVAVLAFMDQHFAWLGGHANSPTFLYCMAAGYLGIWSLTMTREDPWHTMLLPTFVLLLFVVLEFVPLSQVSLAVSLALAWTLVAHVVLRRYPHHFESWYETLIKFGLLRANPLFFLGIKIIAILWALMAVASLPILLFRMAVQYRVLYAGTAMVAGGILGHARSADWQTHGLILWVLAGVICIQIFQTLAQRLADYGLKKFSKK